VRRPGDHTTSHYKKLRPLRDLVKALPRIILHPGWYAAIVEWRGEGPPSVDPPFSWQKWRTVERPHSKWANGAPRYYERSV